MKIEKRILSADSRLPRPFGNTEDLCLLDIETTGLARKNAWIAFAGCAYRKEGRWTVRQWFAETREEEPALLASYLDFLSRWPLLGHFNGCSFDLPCLRKRSEACGLAWPLGEPKSLDLYRLLKPLRVPFSMDRLSQRSFESFLGQERAPQDNDLTMLPFLLPLLACRVLDQEIRSLADCRLLLEGGIPCLRLDLELLEALPRAFSCRLEDLYLKAEGNRLSLLVYGFAGTLKYFLDDYKNYFYLPDEDQAIHKSVASFLGKESRIPARKTTCYTKKEGVFLPKKNAVIHPTFRSSYQSRKLWFEASPQWLADETALLEYVRTLLRDFPEPLPE